MEYRLAVVWPIPGGGRAVVADLPFAKQQKSRWQSYQAGFRSSCNSPSSKTDWYGSQVSRISRSSFWAVFTLVALMRLS